jgi:Zn-dependent M28 family amino/carboxypeptidase
MALAFDGARAMALAAAQLDCGDSPGCVGVRYRIPGTPGNDEVAALLAGWMRGAGLAVRTDNFTATFDGAPLAAHNVVAERPGSGSGTLYLGAHYDSRPCADKDPDAAKRQLPVPAANDGASGVAVLAELAQLLQGRPMNLTLRFVFFDAEDMGDGGRGCGSGSAWAQGSEHYAGGLTDAEVAQARGMVLLDMVGDAELELRRESNSAYSPHRDLQDAVWGWAARLGHAQFRDELGGPVLDDHLPFQRRLIPSLDVIHLDGSADRDPFPATHHTTSDDLAHLRAASLEAVGQSLMAAVLAWDGGGWDNGLK